MASINDSNNLPPICHKHDEYLIISFYERPGSPDGNGFICQSCVKERKEAERTKHEYATTRWPEGAEI